MTGPTNVSSKRKLRLENKKKKMAALLDIVKLNECDRQKNKLHQQDHQKEPNFAMIAEPSAKKFKPEQKEDGSANVDFVKPKLEGEAFDELKKMLRDKTNKIRNSPKFRLRDMGESATLKIRLENRSPLFLSDIQHLIMYSQVGVHSPYSPTRWCSLEKYNRLKSVNLLIVENVSLYHYEAFESEFQFLKSNFEHKIEFVSPLSYRGDIIKELSMVPLSATQMRKLINEYGTMADAAKNCTEIFDTVKNFFPIDECPSEPRETISGLPASDKFSRTQLLLSGWQMIEENFPLPIKGLVERKYADYKLTKEKYKNVTPTSPMVGIDCEMCRTSTGELELTRVSAVNEKHEVFYDTLVKPDNKIVDYLTRFSGINSKMMRSVTKKLKDVQNDLRRILPDDVILVGQSLSNDLHALKMMHPYVIDTSVIYNITGDRARKSKLQTLAQEFLNETIQSGHGHCSNEDSLACMKLTQLKLKKHLYFGDAIMGSIFTEQRAYPDIGTSSYATSMLRQCTKMDKTASVVGVDDTADKYKFYVDKNVTREVTNIACTSETSNRGVVKKFCENLNRYSLNVGQIRIAETELDNSNKAFNTLDKWIGEVYACAEMPTLLAVMFGGQKDGGNGACFLQLHREYV
ncbi:uncharacterized protein LOC132707200 isoform X2 [Cylas formicarius]|nr:uncharacterized protein LOC132707200 isoform X2 [Cylas formicarius]XP_060534929.1 uncharacterized protein LOC132707200 isoform X2 [Cylas formicarius]